MKSGVIGIPRALLFYKYEEMWRTFFSELGFEVLVSEPTTYGTVERGSSLATDEACLSLKIFFGHVDALVGKCDYIFIPRVSTLGRRREMCTRFMSLYDMAENIFRGRGQKFLTFNLDVASKEGEMKAYLSLGQALGAPIKSAITAYKHAEKELRRARRDKLQAQKQLLSADGLKILIAAHSYLYEDACIGRPVVQFLRKNGAVPINAAVVDTDSALKRSDELSPTCKWELNRELLGSIATHREDVDGIIFLSAFPCGPDAMVNELLLRRLSGVPMLNLVMDDQSGTAGIETRLESFLDIIRFKRGTL